MTITTVVYGTTRHTAAALSVQIINGAVRHFMPRMQQSCSDDDEPAAGHACSLRREQRARRGRNPHLVERRHVAVERDAPSSALQSRDSERLTKHSSVSGRRAGTTHQKPCKMAVVIAYLSAEICIAKPRKASRGPGKTPKKTAHAGAL